MGARDVMDDRALLEAAARAAGPEYVNLLSHGKWNPLTDDGDAFRLAVKLRMRLQVDDYGAAARIGDNGRWHGFEAHLHGGIEAATRRAVVRAAAAMGSEK